MSLIDPREAEKRKNAGYRGAPVALVATLVFSLCTLLAVALIGFGAGGMIDQVRVMSLNSVFGNWDTNIPVAVRGLAIPLGILATIVFLGQYGKWNHRFTGRDDSYAIVGPLTLILIGLALGTWVSTTMWVEPDAVGIAVDPTFSEDEPWGAGAWILYTAKWWLPGGLAILAVLSLLTRFAGRRQRARRDVRVSDLLRDGRLVDAEVTEAPLPVPNAARMAATIVVRFQDAHQDTRWVSCAVILPPQRMPAVGARLPLVYDPSAPGDASRIFLSPTGGREAADFQKVTTAR